MKRIFITLLIISLIIPAVNTEDGFNNIIDNSKSNDTIKLENNAYASSPMVIDKNRTITSNVNSVINGNSNQFFTIEKCNSLTLQGVTIINAYGEYGGALIIKEH